MKKCVVCQIDKSDDCFYVTKRTGGLESKCKDCRLARNRANYQASIEQRREHDRIRSTNNPKRQALKNAYEHKKDQNKVKSRRFLQRSVRAGTVEKFPCVICGSAYSFAHHEDYSKPLDVVWFCRKHHAERHREIDREKKLELAGRGA